MLGFWTRQMRALKTNWGDLREVQENWYLTVTILYGQAGDTVSSGLLPADRMVWRWPWRGSK